MKSQTKAYIYALLSVLFWSTVATAFKLSLKYLSSIDLLLYSSFTSLIILFIIVMFKGNLKLLFSYSVTDILRSLCLGFLNPFLYYIILFKAYDILSAQEALTLNYSWAVVVVILSIPILKQQIKIIDFVSILISFTGVIVIATQGDILSLKFSNIYGVILALSSSIIWALFWLFNVRDNRDSIIKLLLNFFSGFLFILIYILLFDEFHIPVLTGLYGAVYIGFFEMGITFVCWLTALKYSVTTAKISNLIYLSPFLSLLIINFALKEKILISTISGLILIISGIVIQQILKPQKTSQNKYKSYQVF